jgi:tRNA 2-thiouridine synthesizing protein A
MTKITDQKNITPDAVADLEEMGCGDLIIALMKAMKPLKAGQVLKVRALDPGASTDIPAWCRMRGYELLAVPGGGSDTFYYIKKR